MKNVFCAAFIATMATPALAHHPLGGLPMETFVHGLRSGAGHPLLGYDHLFFVIVMGVAALFTAARLTSISAYILAVIVGCLFTAAGVSLPITEVVIALSLLTLGTIVVSGQALGVSAAIALFAGFGLFHGMAFGGAIIGAEGVAGAQVWGGYLIGLAVFQYAIAVAAGWVLQRSFGVVGAYATAPRLVGAMVAGMGLLLCLEAIEGPLLALLVG